MKGDDFHKATELLSELISIPSISKEEDKAADLLCRYLEKYKVPYNRIKNNIWCTNKNYNASKPSILLNSHLDTVKPNPNYTRDPFKAEIIDYKFYGLGINDAGASLVSLLMCFLHYYNDDGLPFNLVFAASAEEEISGSNGMELLLRNLPEIDAAIVGEPTSMRMAIAENGLLVLDCKTNGVAGHAAHGNGSNAIYNAIRDIEWFRTYSFEKESRWLGKVKMQVTQVTAGQQHNVVPAECNFVTDVRITDAYTAEEVITEIRNNVACDVIPRSTRLKPTAIEETHPLIQAGKELGLKPFGSTTLSDKALMPFPSIKMGPGDTLRSHVADEFIFLRELQEGIETYIHFIDALRKYY